MDKTYLIPCVKVFFLYLIYTLSAQATCTVSSISVNFGNYNVFASSNAGSTGQLTVTCSPANTPYTVALNNGLHGTIAQRVLKLTTGTDTMLYNLYTDSARTILWGDGTTNGVTVSAASSAPLIVYGSLTPLQNVSTGLYTDSVSVTVTF